MHSIYNNENRWARLFSSDGLDGRTHGRVDVARVGSAAIEILSGWRVAHELSTERLRAIDGDVLWKGREWALETPSTAQWAKRRRTVTAIWRARQRLPRMSTTQAQRSKSFHSVTSTSRITTEKICSRNMKQLPK
jgi:hypothetical protein